MGSWKAFLTSIYQILFFGILSYLFGLVNFSIPEVDGAASNLAEISLIICVFHIRNPLQTIGICLIAALATPASGSIWSSFIMHFISIIIIWFVYSYLTKLNLRNIFRSLIWLIVVFVYYLVLLLPLMVITNFLFGLNTDKTFVSFYLELVFSIRFELILSAIITSLYLLQHLQRIDLKKHKEELENIVKERTKQLTATIQELKSTQEYLVQSEKMASLGTLTAGVAHEINNPLNFISGGINIISNLKGEFHAHATSKEAREQYDSAIGMVESGLLRATNIVKALMTFSYRGTPKLIETSINELIDNSLLFLNYKTPNDVTIKKDYQLHSKVPVFAEKIHQVIINIVDNAIYELNRSDRIEKFICISTFIKEEKAFIRISNSGKSIPENQLKQIFDPFFTTKEPDQGTGLGLSMCYTMIQEHKGKIYAENIEDGVVFTIEIPVGKS